MCDVRIVPLVTSGGVVIPITEIANVYSMEPRLEEFMSEKLSRDDLCAITDSTVLVKSSTGEYHTISFDDDDNKTYMVKNSNTSEYMYGNNAKRLFVHIWGQLVSEGKAKLGKIYD